MPLPPRSVKGRKNVPVPTGTTLLFWTGSADPHVVGATYVPGVPARDLDEHDFERYVFVRSAKSIKPGTAEYTAARDTIVSFLLGTGLYSNVKMEATPEAPANSPDTPAAAEPAKE